MPLSGGWQAGGRCPADLSIATVGAVAIFGDDGKLNYCPRKRLT